MFNRNQNQQQQQQQNYNMGAAISSSQISTGFDSGENTEQVKYVLNSDDVIKEIDEFLSGIRYEIQEDKDGKPIMVGIKFADPIISEKGRSEIIRELKTRLSRIYITSIKSEQEICNIARVFGRSLHKLITIKRRDWGIELSNKPVIVHSILDAVKATLDKSRDGKFLDFLKDTSKVVEMRQFGNKPLPQNVKMYNAR